MPNPSVTRVVKVEKKVGAFHQMLSVSMNGQPSRITRSRIESVVGKIPDSSYRVTYTVAEHGKFFVTENVAYLRVHGKRKEVSCCMLNSDKFRGKRVDRKVEVI